MNTQKGLDAQIEPRYVNLTETCFVAPPEKIAAACDKNTIGVVGILGTTYSGHYEDLAGIDAAISKIPPLVKQDLEFVRCPCYRYPALSCDCVRSWSDII